MADKSEKSGKSDPYAEAKKELLFGAGYKKPPEHTQFRKGQSGNRKGRPRKKSGTPSDLTLAQQPTLAAVHRAAEKAVTVREGDQVREISAREAVIQSMIVGAVKGNSKSQAEAVRLFQAADEANAQAIELRNSVWSAYKAEKNEEIAKAKKEGRPEPIFLPHPDDVITNRETGPKIIGPFDADSQAKVNETIALRDLLIMQDVLDHRSTKRLDGEPLTEPGSAMLLAIALDKTLPPRLQFSDWDWFKHHDRYERLPKRDLLKRLFKEWRKVGRPLPRGYVFPNRKDIIPYLKFCFAAGDAVMSGEIDALNEGRADVEEKLADLMERNGLTPM